MVIIIIYDDEVQTSNIKIELGALYRSYMVRCLKQKATITTDCKQFKTQETNLTRHTLHIHMGTRPHTAHQST